ncbi:hypothetical protein NDS46_31645 (plasmid) [Paenibacillus thiaminolyticus]|uniref:hypothetical protein n=1 Tax=Paenibacillus thiaminolyticus TaxID=49283 RepID=UPI00232CC3E4|nr:hypothetical protein [Paenibacillus thiaminolyticus]WCF11513.1 hypothetical protein NDS46_31645 [Paenibacillus thiaminolyticus]
MSYFEQSFEEYINELRTYLFGDISIDEIFNGAIAYHRNKRFIMMYLLKDRETFSQYYLKRHALGLENIFNQIIASLFFEREKMLIKRKIISKLRLAEEMIVIPVSDVDKRVVTKDLQAFVWYATKKVLISPV